MKFDDIHPTFREALGIHEALRKCGFSSDDIYVYLNPPATFLSMFDPNYGKTSMLVVLKTQDKDFSVNVGFLDLNHSKWEQAWKEICAAVIEHQVNEEDLDKIWQSCMAFKDKLGFVLAIGEKGIAIPGSTDGWN